MKTCSQNDLVNRKLTVREDVTMMEKYTWDGPGEVRKQMNRQAVKKEGFFYHPPFIFCFWTFIRFSLKTWLLYFKNLYLLLKSQIPSHVIIIHYSLITIVCFFCLPLFAISLTRKSWIALGSHLTTRLLALQVIHTWHLSNA